MAIAIAVVALSFIGILGLLGVGLQTGQASTQQTMATNIADSIIADVRSTPAFSTTSKSVRFQLPLPTPSATPYSGATPFAASTAHFAYFDVNGNFISLDPSPVPTNAIYKATVNEAPIVTVGPIPLTSVSQMMVMVRVLVTWPAAAAKSAGSLEIVTQARIH